jgi:hypothetical protein
MGQHQLFDAAPVTLRVVTVNPHFHPEMWGASVSLGSWAQ